MERAEIGRGRSIERLRTREREEGRVSEKERQAGPSGLARGVANSSLELANTWRMGNISHNHICRQKDKNKD